MPADRWDLFEIVGDADAAYAWFMAHAGEPYDWSGVVRFACPAFGESSSRWFCSEAVLTALRWTEGWRFTPADLAAMALASDSTRGWASAAQPEETPAPSLTAL
ncbi:MAG: hypothetical protein QM803_00975 [Rhodocyclaceae bacterium]